MKKSTILLLLVPYLALAQQKTERTLLKEELKKEILQELRSKKTTTQKSAFQKFRLKGYGAINYYNYNWESDNTKRNEFDTERLNLYLYYNFTSNIQLKAEFEFEHGGTGVTMELDKLEEAGEYETEIENGGEVNLEQLNILFKYKSWLNFKLGRIKLYVGNASKIDESTDYFTGQLSNTENALLPLGWYENGIEILGDFGKNKTFSYHLALINGLSSTGFSSRNWIKWGHQKRFERINADNLAASGRFDYNLSSRKNSKIKGYIGLSFYHGNSNNNRPKTDLENTKGAVSIIDFHTNIERENWKIRAMLLYGNIQNSDKISKANRNLSNALNVKRTPVGKNALGYYVSAGYNVLSLLNNPPSQKLYLFGRYDFFDSMYKTAGNVVDNPRWERKIITLGANYFINPSIVFKAHYDIKKIGIPSNNIDRTFLLGIAFDFSSKN